MPKFDDEDEYDDDSTRVKHRNRKAVYKAIIKEQNGKLSMSHITLEPRAQAGIPLPVKKDEVIGFGWKEESNVKFKFEFDYRVVCCSAVYWLSTGMMIILWKCISRDSV